jgi:hypothetical protein
MRRTVTLLLLIAFAVNLLIMVGPAKAQNAPRPNIIIDEDEPPPQLDPFAQEILVVANSQGVHAARDWVIGQMALQTTRVIAEEAAFSLLELSFGFTPCRASRYAICDSELNAALLRIAAQSAVRASVCLAAAIAAGVTGPGAIIAFAVCMSAAAALHAIDLAAAKNAHRLCYIRARQACDIAATPTPTPTPAATPPPSPTPPLPNPFPIFPPPRPTPCPAIFPNSNLPLGAEALQAPVGDIAVNLADCSGVDDPCLCRPRSPIIIDVNGDGFDLTSLNEGVRFNITGSGKEQLGWTKAGSDDAFLALDLNDNGEIDNGLELFGNFTFQPDPPRGQERNGFLALAYFDDNKDGKIDELDSIYSTLRLWTDRNHNGEVDYDELQKLEKLQIKTLFLDYVSSERVDKFGNEFRYSARVLHFGENLSRVDRLALAYDVFLVSGRPSRRLGGAFACKRVSK